MTKTELIRALMAIPGDPNVFVDGEMGQTPVTQVQHLDARDRGLSLKTTDSLDTMEPYQPRPDEWIVLL